MASKNALTRGKKQKAHALLTQHRLTEAKLMLEQVCRIDRRDAEAWYLLAAANQHLGKLDEAATCYRQTLSLHPDNAEAHYHLGNVLSLLKQETEAARHYRGAIALNPGYIEAHCNLGGLYEQQGRLAEALVCYRQAMHLAPERPELHYNVGSALRQLGQLDAAEEHYRSAIRLKPGFAEAYNNLANLLQQRCKVDEAIAYYRRAIELKPEYAEAFYNLSVSLRDIGRITEAIAGYRRAIELNKDYADAHFGLSILLLLTGNFQEGWREYEWRWRRPGSPSRPLPASTWVGDDLGGQKVFLHAEQGLGDELFFLRFIPWLKSLGAGTVTYRPNPKIASLLARCPGIDHVAGAQELPTAGQLVLAIGDLPRLLGMKQIEQIPVSLRLAPSTDRIASLRRRLKNCGPPPYLGVTWRAGTKDNMNNLYKEMPLLPLAAAFKERPVTILVLQRHPRRDEIEAFGRELGRPVHDFSAANDDLEDMLALLALIDEYVGVSNTNMHLRAAVGETARVLVPAPPEWRWMAEGRESPWFPGFTVYRQGYDGGWAQAFDMLATNLQRTLGH